MEGKVFKVFADSYEVKVNELSRQTRLEEDLHSKSMNMFGLLAMLEAVMGKAPALAPAMKMKTIGDFVDFYLD